MNEILLRSQENILANWNIFLLPNIFYPAPFVFSELALSNFEFRAIKKYILTYVHIWLIHNSYKKLQKESDET